MSEQETKALMDAILGGFREQKAMTDGLTHDLARLRDEMEAFRKEVRQDIADVRQALRGPIDNIEQQLAYFRDKWMEHDQAIFQLRRKQLAMQSEAQG